jgi:hypothetical protein
MDDLISALQWPAMAATLLASWLVTSTSVRTRHAGFWCFLASNVLWVAWGWGDRAYGLIVLQMALAFTNIRGVFKSEKGATR